jgi:tetratricopeptide (TPR) repeat protein
MPEPQPETSSGPDLFVGRAAELEALTAACGDARVGRGRLFLVCGEPGIGKTALADEAGRRAEAAGFLTLWGRCWKGGGAPAFWPWVQLIRACMRSPAAAALDDLAGVTGDLARVVPELAGRDTGQPQGRSVTPEQERFRLFGSTASLLRAVAASRPLALLLDDLQWADEASLLLLDFIARELRGAPVLIVGTYREGEAGLNERVAPLLEQISREGQTLLLRGFGADETADLVVRRSSHAPSELMLAEIWRITEGNPLFIEEVLQLLWSERRRDAGDGRIKVPDGVRDVLRRRLDCLTDETRSVLSAAAVIGREFDLDVAARTAGEDGGRAEAAIAEAMTAGVLLAAGGRYRFSHALIGETLYEDLPSPQRVRLHRQAAAALLAHVGADVEAHLDELAHHFLGAAPGGDAAAAVDWATRAGDHAVSQLAFESGARAFSRALDVMRAFTPPPDGAPAWEQRRIELLLRLGGARLHFNDLGGSDAAFREAIGAARELGDGGLFARAALGLGAARFERGGSDGDLVAVLREALDRVGDTMPAQRSRLLSRLAASSYLRGADRRQLDLTQEAIELARQCGDRGALASALTARHSLCWQRDDVAERLQLAKEIVRLAEAAGEEEAALDGLGWKIFDLLEIGESAAAEAAIAAYERRAEQTRLARQRWYACVYRTMLAMLRGRYAEAEKMAERGLAIRQADGAPPSQFYAAQLFTIRRDQGRLRELEPAVQAVARQYEHMPTWQCVLALYHAAVGDETAARRVFERLSARNHRDFPVDVTWLPSMSMLAEVCDFLDDARRAEGLYALMQPYAGRNVVVVGNVAVRGAVDFFLALLARAMRRWDAAAAHFAAACEAHERLGAPPLVALAKFEWARTLQRQGAADAKAAVLGDQALAIAANIGMTRLYASERAAAAAGPSFFKQGDHWAVTFEGKPGRLKESRGCAYIARLLSQPGEAVAASELTAAGGAQSEEQARIAVRKAISVVLRALAREHPALAAHLEASLRTGRQCVYAPEVPVVWSV